MTRDEPGAQPAKTKKPVTDRRTHAGNPRFVGGNGKRRRRKKSRPADIHAGIPADYWTISDFVVPEMEGKTRFHDLNLPEALMHAICDLGFKYCTPIQEELLPSTLSGRDANGRAQTGTGKTAVFLITAITRILNNPVREGNRRGTPRVLILAPTRELVAQITEDLRGLAKYCDIRFMAVFGGMNYAKQQAQLAEKPVDIITATPGRLMDFQRRGDINLGKVELLVIDEADRMLDMGFIPDVRKIVYSTPFKSRRQTLLFSATLTPAITRLASQWTRNPVTVEIDPEQVVVDTVDQTVYIVTVREKFALLYNIITRQNLDRVLVFCNRKDEVRRLSGLLDRYGINNATLSGDVPQKSRMRRLEAFKNGTLRVLVATDVAGRGIHIEDMGHVINFTLPHEPEDYVHRIGRTGRAGCTGAAISFADESDAFYIPEIEQFIERKLEAIVPDEDWLHLPDIPRDRRRPRHTYRSGRRKRKR